MGNHGVAGARPRAAKTNEQAKQPSIGSPPGARIPTLRNWPVSWRLIAVIVLALGMGLVFGGLRVSAAADNADEFSRVATARRPRAAGQPAWCRRWRTSATRRRDPSRSPVPRTSQPLQPWYQATNAAAAKVKTLAAGVGGSFPANIQSRVATVLSDDHRTSLTLRGDGPDPASPSLALIDAYSTPINDLITLNDQIDQGTSDPGLVNDVETLDSLALAKDEAAQQRALLYNALPPQLFADGVQQALTTAQSEELTDINGVPADRHRAGAELVRQHRGRVAGERGPEHRDLRPGHRQPATRPGRPEHQRDHGARAVVHGSVGQGRRHAAGRAGHSQEHRARGPRRCSAARSRSRAVHRHRDRR